MADVSKIKLPNNTEVNIKDSRIPGVDSTPTSGSENVVTSGGVYSAVNGVEHFYFVQGSSSAAGNGNSGSYLSVKWEGTVPGVSAATDGLKLAYRIATRTGVATAGVVLSIDGTNYYPVVIQKNTLVTTHYPVGATILMVFNSTQTATAYLTSNTKSTVTGCWQIMEYDSNTNTYQREYVSSGDVEYPITTRYNTTTGESYYAEYGRYSEGVTLNPSTNTITASKFKVTGGTSSQFLKADGSVDSNTYATTGQIPDTSSFVEVDSDGLINNQTIGVLGITDANGVRYGLGISGSGDANIMTDDLYTIPSAPGTLNTTATTAQSTNASEALSGSITLHKVSKTGSYNDLLNKPTIPTVPVTDVTVGGTSVLSNGVAAVPAIPDTSNFITGVTLNGTAATVSNGVASITDRQVIVLDWDANDVLTFPSGVSPSTLPACGIPIILKGAGLVNAVEDIDHKPVDYCVVTLFEYEPEDSVEEYGQWVGISGIAQCGPILYSIVAEFETPFGSNFFEKTQFYGNELFYSGSIATSFYNGSVTDNMVPGALLMWNTLASYPKYVLCADESAYEAITTKDSGTLYLIPEE